MIDVVQTRPVETVVGPETKSLARRLMPWIAGNLAGVAAGTSQMGILLTAQCKPADAVSWHVRALAIRLELGVPQVWIDVRALKELREGLGTEQFVAAIGDRLDDANRTDLMDSDAEEAGRDTSG
jgi:hypothetical protein